MSFCKQGKNVLELWEHWPISGNRVHHIVPCQITNQLLSSAKRNYRGDGLQELREVLARRAIMRRSSKLQMASVVSSIPVIMLRCLSWLGDNSAVSLPPGDRGGTLTPKPPPSHSPSRCRYGRVVMMMGVAGISLCGSSPGGLVCGPSHRGPVHRDSCPS